MTKKPKKKLKIINFLENVDSDIHFKEALGHGIYLARGRIKDLMSSLNEDKLILENCSNKFKQKVNQEVGSINQFKSAAISRIHKLKQMLFIDYKPIQVVSNELVDQQNETKSSLTKMNTEVINASQKVTDLEKVMFNCTSKNIIER